MIIKKSHICFSTVNSPYHSGWSATSPWGVYAPGRRRHPGAVALRTTGSTKHGRQGAEECLHVAHVCILWQLRASSTDLGECRTKFVKIQVECVFDTMTVTCRLQLVPITAGCETADKA